MKLLTDTPDPATVSRRRRGLGFEASMLVTPLLGAVLGAVLSVAITVAVFAIFFEDEGGGEGAILGAIAIFLLAWLASFVVMSLVVGAWLARRPALRPHNRITLTLLLGLWVPVSVIAGGAAAWFGYRSGLEAIGGGLGAIIGIGFLAMRPALVDRARLKKLVMTVAAVVVVFVLAVVVLEAGHRRSIYASNPPPMGLISQSDLAEALPGWEVTSTDDAPRDGGWPWARINVKTAQGAELEVRFVPDRTSCSSGRGDCVVVDVLDDGSAVTVWSDYATCGVAGPPPYVSARVDRPEGMWVTDSQNRCSDPLQPSIDELHTLIMLVRPVTVAEWVAET